jgi:hypothetical protein
MLLPISNIHEMVAGRNWSASSDLASSSYITVW